MKFRPVVGRLCGAALTLFAMPAGAQDSIFESVGKATGLISPPADPPDFVKASRPSQEPAAIPAFAPPQEPRSKVKSPAELKALNDDLERASQRQRGGADPVKPAKRARKVDKHADAQG